MSEETRPSLDASKKALVLFSGGQDSTTCLARALEDYEHVETIGFNYGQRHAVEMECRLKILSKIEGIKPQWKGKLGVDHVINLNVFGEISETSLTRETAIEFASTGLPTTFIPGRNLIFLNFAGAIAYRRHIKHLVTGVCETDYSGYPDCRDDTVKATQLSLNLGMATQFVIHTPLMWINKAATWEMAESLGGESLIRLIVEETHTCYLGNRKSNHAWGYGCGSCPACELREQGWTRYSFPDRNTLCRPA